MASSVELSEVIIAGTEYLEGLNLLASLGRRLSPSSVEGDRAARGDLEGFFAPVLTEWVRALGRGVFPVKELIELVDVVL